VIKLHKLNGTEIVINAELIQSIESVPDTRIILTTGNQLIVKESVDYVIAQIKEYSGDVHAIGEKKKEKLTGKDKE
jgi:flagellar protein FlbD